MNAVTKRIAIAANSASNILIFRQELIAALGEAGYEPVVIVPPDQAAAERIAALGVDSVPVRMSRSGLNPLADLALLRSYARALKTIRPAAFLGFTIKPNIYGCIAAGALGIPAIANVSGLGTVFVKRSPLTALVKRMYRFAFRRAAVVFFHNRDDRDLFVGSGIVRAEQARLLPGSGIDLERYAATPLPAGPVKFLLIARLLGDKGVREYVDAARVLRDQLPDAKFQLLGAVDADNRTSVRRDELDRWVVEGVVDYFGSTDDVRPFIEQATAVVLPSYREGLPRSLLEGAAMGRPLIATDVPGCRDVVESGVSGLLCAARDASSLAKCMKAFAELPPVRRAEMGAAARRIAQERFGHELVVRAYLEALEQVARQPS